MRDLSTIHATYLRDGYVVVPSIIAADALAELRERITACQEGRAAHIERRFEAAGGATAPAVRKLEALAVGDPWFRTVASSPAIVEVVARLTGSAGAVHLYADQAFLKPAFHGSEKPMHQDNAYFRVAPVDAGVTCWIAVDDATTENGCLNYIPGTHREGLAAHRQVSDAHLEVASAGTIVPCPIPAGSAVFHHLLVHHSSGANRSSAPRCAWALHYVAGHATCPAKSFSDMLRVA